MIWTVLVWLWNALACFGLVMVGTILYGLWEGRDTFRYHSMDGDLLHIWFKPGLFSKPYIRTIVHAGSNPPYWQDTGSELLQADADRILEVFQAQAREAQRETRRLEAGSKLQASADKLTN